MNRLSERIAILIETAPEEIDAAAHHAATSPSNDTPQPSDDQKKTGNYKKGHLTLHSLRIAIENPKGSERSGVDKSGKRWSVTMKHHYGYLKATTGRDNDHLDVFIGPNPESEKVFVVNQVDPDTGKFDEHKIMMGFDSADEAKAGYLSNYEKGWKGIGSMVSMTLDEFKVWVSSGDTKKPVTSPRDQK